MGQGVKIIAKGVPVGGVLPPPIGSGAVVETIVVANPAAGSLLWSEVVPANQLWNVIGVSFDFFAGNTTEGVRSLILTLQGRQAIPIPFQLIRNESGNFTAVQNGTISVGDAPFKRVSMAFPENIWLNAGDAIGAAVDFGNDVDTQFSNINIRIIRYTV